MSNAILMIIYDRTREQFLLSQATLASLLSQDIPTNIFILDNGSTFKPTREWLSNLSTVHVFSHGENGSPIRLANSYLKQLFDSGYSQILCVPNDVVLPPNLYREFLKWPRGIVTGSQTEQNPPPPFFASTATSECTPMAVALIRRWCYDALIAKDGHFFDPQYFLWASDCDMALRIAACGIRGVQLDIQYWHYRSASYRLATGGDFSGDADRAYFTKKWGFCVDAAAYEAAARDINFRAIPAANGVSSR